MTTHTVVFERYGDREDIYIRIPGGQFPIRMSCKFSDGGVPELNQGETYMFNCDEKPAPNGGFYHNLIGMGSGVDDAAESAPTTSPQPRPTPPAVPRASAPATVDLTRQSIERQTSLKEARQAAKDIAELGGLDEGNVVAAYFAVWRLAYQKALEMLAGGA